jgi:hypothetical protein
VLAPHRREDGLHASHSAPQVRLDLRLRDVERRLFDRARHTPPRARDERVDAAVGVDDGRDARNDRRAVVDVHHETRPFAARRAAAARANHGPAGRVKSVGARATDARRRTGNEDHLLHAGSLAPDSSTCSTRRATTVRRYRPGGPTTPAGSAPSPDVVVTARADVRRWHAPTRRSARRV